MSWSSEVWEKSLKIYQAILRQPFIKELAAGTLDADRFTRYIAQDEVYLGNYGRQMEEFAQLMDDPQEKAFFMEYAKSGMEGEAAMHQLLIDRFQMDIAVQSSVVTSTYNGRTQKAVDTGVKEIGLAALLPCAWIYNEVGLQILETAKLDGNPYKEWILEYGNEEFTRGTRILVDMIDEWAEKADEATRQEMTRVYIEGAICEYAFWEYGYNGDAGNYDYLKTWILEV